MASDHLSVARFVHIPLIAGVLISGCQTMAQSKQEWDVERLCGRVEYVQRIPDKKFANTFSERRRGVGNLTMALFERRSGQPCCGSLVALETTKTARNGRFEFKTKRPGALWLTTNWHAKEYKVPIVNKQQNSSSSRCSEQGIGLDDSGNADWWATITVD